MRILIHIGYVNTRCFSKGHGQVHIDSEDLINGDKYGTRSYSHQMGSDVWVKTGIFTLAIDLI